MEQYKASYSILCGEEHDGRREAVSLGRTYLFKADNNENALRMAIDEAKSFAYDYKTSPDTGLTMVLLMSVDGEEGEIPYKKEGSVVILHKWDHFVYCLFGYLKK